MSAVVTTLVSAVTSLTVAVASLVVSGCQKRRGDEEAERRVLNSQYLNPLRFHLVENHFRLSDTLGRIEAEGGTCQNLLVVEDPSEVSGKDAGWFNGVGCALASSVYLTACLFGQLKKVREDFPYLRLSDGDDTELAALLLGVQRGFLRDGGVFYVVQPSIGETMWLRTEGRLRSYREFCELLQNPDERLWFDPLIRFHLDTGTGHRTERARSTVAAMLELADFLDRCVGGGRSIQRRWAAEGINLP